MSPERTRELVLRFLRRRVRDEATAEDLTHETLLRAHRSRDRLRDPERADAWLLRIARNVLAEHARGRAPIDPATEVEALLAPAVEEASLEQELAACLPAWLEQLPPAKARVLRLVDVEGRTVAEAARAQGLSRTAAKSRLRHARALLRRRLLACCRFESDARGAWIDVRRRGSCGEQACSAPA